MMLDTIHVDKGLHRVRFPDRENAERAFEILCGT